MHGLAAEIQSYEDRLGRKMDDDACGGNIEKVTGNHCSSLFL
jgi:hypothetical protein